MLRSGSPAVTGSGGTAAGDSPAGGDGGDGGHGGHGGGGGGGAGGVAVGIFEVLDRNPILEAIAYSGGTAGSGGAGGASAPSAPVAERDGNDGISGDAGSVSVVLDCNSLSTCP
nr:hypothetical protein [Actinomycetota bacterium]